MIEPNLPAASPEGGTTPTPPVVVEPPSNACGVLHPVYDSRCPGCQLVAGLSTESGTTPTRCIPCSKPDWRYTEGTNLHEVPGTSRRVRCGNVFSKAEYDADMAEIAPAASPPVPEPGEPDDELASIIQRADYGDPLSKSDIVKLARHARTLTADLSTVRRELREHRDFLARSEKWRAMWRKGAMEFSQQATAAESRALAAEQRIAAIEGLERFDPMHRTWTMEQQDDGEWVRLADVLVTLSANAETPE